MANIFTLENVTDFSEKLNIDDLYEKKKQYDLSKLALYNKILNRIHVRIKTTARQKIDEQYCWFVVPEVIIGVPKYDNGLCIAYLLDKLKENGFNVKYIHPNTLLIAWAHWVPSYVRTELKKKTGIVIDEYGKQISQEDGDQLKLENGNNNPRNLDEMMFKLKDPNGSLNLSKNQSLQNKKFTPINSYKPQGNLIYDEDLMNKLEDKFL
uniref:Uncharacterized protein n=1 Tax=viral metagenome TaxID=1070528 RepID=A0A6C0EV38_9ZZZZ